jgi:hypothetical protein
LFEAVTASFVAFGSANHVRIEEPIHSQTKDFFINRESRNGEGINLFVLPMMDKTMEKTVMKYRSIGVACLAVALAAASPVFARGGGGGGHGGGGGGHGFGGGGFHGGSGGFAGAGFRGGGAHFAGGGFRGGGFGGGYRRGFGGGYGGYGGYGYDGYGTDIAGGLIVGSLVGAGLGYGYGDDPGYSDDAYAYAPGPVTVDSGYCIQRYRSYDPASGTYLGNDGMRHPCQ